MSSQLSPLNTLCRYIKENQLELFKSKLQYFDDIMTMLEINNIDSEGNVPLILAVQLKRFDMTKILLQKTGVDMYIQNNEQKDLFDYVSERTEKNNQIRNLIQEYRMSWN